MFFEAGSMPFGACSVIFGAGSVTFRAGSVTFRAGSVTFGVAFLWLVQYKLPCSGLCATICSSAPVYVAYTYLSASPANQMSAPAHQMSAPAHLDLPAVDGRTKPTPAQVVPAPDRLEFCRLCIYFV